MFFQRYTYLSLGISLSCSFVTVFELFCCKFFGNPVILLTILLPIELRVTSPVFRITLFKEVLNASVANCLVRSRIFSLYLPLKFWLIYFY